MIRLTIQFVNLVTIHVRHVVVQVIISASPVNQLKIENFLIPIFAGAPWDNQTMV
jgi:hypothetical protein